MRTRVRMIPKRALVWPGIAERPNSIVRDELSVDRD
jgi:hypothetical protein